MKDNVVEKQQPCAEDGCFDKNDKKSMGEGKECCESLIRSMPGHLKEVIKSSGGHTKYQIFIKQELIKMKTSLNKLWKHKFYRKT